MRSSYRTVADAATIALALLWAGLLVGVSFVATPVKFAAPGLSLPVALEVGQVTFHLFSRIEWALAVLLAAAAAGGRSPRRLLVAAALAGLVALQALWLLPALDDRVAAVIAGTSPPPSDHHTFYAAAEGAKFLLLAAVGLGGLRSLARGRH